MQINWFTVIAQVLNFLLLVWLLKRFLYKPILQAIDEREKRITAQLADAEAKKAEAKKEQDDYRQKNEAFDQQKRELMDRAVAETTAQRQQLLEDARKEAATVRSNGEKALQEMQENLKQEIAQKTQREVFAITRKTLTDLASVSLEEQSVDVFIRRLMDATAEEKKQFLSAFRAGANPILVRSAFDLPEKQRAALQKTVNDLLGPKAALHFEITPELISGIELTASGYKLAWSVSEYLVSLEKSVSEMKKEKRQAADKKEAHAIQ